jgi:CheY-like chemotaxis protein
VLVQSAGVGHGSEFTVRLPLAVLSDTSPKTPGEEMSSTPPSTGHRVLVVDDNRDAAITLSMVLRLQGHQVQVAHDGPTALEMTSEFQPDMIFLDIGMPGMDGYEVARRIRTSPDLQQPILAALTGWGQEEDRQRTADAGFDHHLVKPPEPQAIEKLLASVPCRA